ncbi:hypothetical protein Hamer_G003579 [Homarus americanus]|uniref:HAT C-terminal dimerisation domain-containing protein n=1 Tax=Homarus americanus TaxID=6706 RepID=A0A8J5MVC5_HOMAM|nr:hypothetical protein Hamer_G003579 [Homarus americanus]
MEDEWAVLKCYLYKMSKISPVSKLSWQQRNESYRKKCGSFLHFVDLLSIPTSSADAEHGFSQVKLIKIDWCSRLTDDHLRNLHVVQLQSECVSNFNPELAINRFLTTWATHVDGYNHTDGCSTEEVLDDIEELDEEHIQKLIDQIQ